MISKLTPEITLGILDLVRECVPVSVAARKMGIDYSTLKTWRAKGAEDPTSAYGEFARAIDEAVAHAEMQMVKAVYGSATSDPKSAMWLLERRFGGRWSPKSKTKVEAKVEHSSKVDMTKLSQAERDQLRGILTKATSG